MKRLLVVMMLFTALPLAAADKLADTYKRGVDAVRAKNYSQGAELLQRAIAEQPTENAALRLRNEIITYVPHFWLGIAKLNLNDVDGALRELKTSEDQGVVQSTQYYASLRDWMSRAQSQKQKDSEAAAAESRNAANSAVSAAMRAKTDAVAAGADRTDGYRAGIRKLQEAMAESKSAGTDPRAFRRSAEMATQAGAMFTAVAEDARKQRAARPVQIAKQTTPAVVQPQPVVSQPQPQPRPVSVPVMPPAVTATLAETKPAVVAPAETTPVVESEALVDARIAVQQYKRHLVESRVASNAQMREVAALEKQLASNANEGTIRKVSERVAANEKLIVSRVAPKGTVTIVDPTLELAYRAYAAGELARAEELLTQLLEAKRSPEALLLRGCTRYTRAVLSRQPNLSAANADLKAALTLNATLRLDPKSFSPKLVAWVDQVRRQ